MALLGVGRWRRGFINSKCHCLEACNKAEVAEVEVAEVDRLRGRGWSIYWGRLGNRCRLGMTRSALRPRARESVAVERVVTVDTRWLSEADFAGLQGRAFSLEASGGALFNSAWCL